MINALAICAFIFSLVSLVLGLWVFILFMAKEKSQHVVQFVPADDLIKDDIKNQPSPYVEFDDPVLKSMGDPKKEPYKPRAVQ